jgi:hypothetical protein
MKKTNRSAKPTKTRLPIKHSKTFSGCWTCRSRHVKCDEGRPSCARCVKGGFDCQGYDVKLVWINGDTLEREQNIRRAIGNPAIYDDDSAFKRVDVDDALDEIETLTQGQKYLIAGPFSVFSAEGNHQEDTTFTRDQTTCSQNPAPASTLERVTIAGSVADLETSQWSIEDDDIETIISPSITESQRTPRHVNLDHWQPNDTIYLSPRHLDLLPRPSEQRALIHHWADFVSWHLVPVDRPDNPFRSVFTPMAVAGLNSPSNESNGQIALFHAMCATSAFSRSQLLNDEPTNQTLAMKHYNLAILHLRHSLNSLNGSRYSSGTGVDLQRGSILATITMFSAMDMITGRSNEWRTHLQGGASWLSTIDESAWARDKSSSMVYQGYLAIAALCNINLPSTVDVESDAFLGDARDYILDRFFGLTRPILKHIIQVNALSKRIGTPSAPTAEELDDLEAQLYAHSPETLDLSTAQDLTLLAHSLTLHHAYVFYYASLIHFHRTLRRLAPSSPVIQQLVTCAVQKLEDIEALGGDSIGCTLVWPPFVVACECVDEEMQQRVLNWYQCKRRHGFMNLEISKDIAKEVWQRRRYQEENSGMDTDIQWQDVLKEMQMDIVLA